jgi:hypothetical protein
LTSLPTPAGKNKKPIPLGMILLFVGSLISAGLTLMIPFKIHLMRPNYTHYLLPFLTFSPFILINKLLPGDLPAKMPTPLYALLGIFLSYFLFFFFFGWKCLWLFVMKPLWLGGGGP